MICVLASSQAPPQRQGANGGVSPDKDSTVILMAWARLRRGQILAVPTVEHEAVGVKTSKDGRAKIRKGNKERRGNEKGSWRFFFLLQGEPG
jgi:hypothetical protein